MSKIECQDLRVLIICVDRILKKDIEILLDVMQENLRSQLASRIDFNHVVVRITERYRMVT